MKRIFYAHSGGVTSVINASLVGLVRAARTANIEVLIGMNGIRGLIHREYFSSHKLSEKDLEKILHTPGGSFGSCRYKLQNSDFQHVCDHIAQDHIEAIVYQGGNDSQSTLLTLSQYFHTHNIHCRTLGLPKTIDNDLMGTEVSPGFGSAAFFLTLSMRQLCLDLRSMCQDSTKIYIMETMGRHSGWLAASTGLSHTSDFPGPHILCVPEKIHDNHDLLNKIQSCVDRDGYCSIAISEGYQSHEIAHSSALETDAFGHKRLQGSAHTLKDLIDAALHMKTRLCIPDYLQRSCAMMRSDRDVAQSVALGEQAIVALTQSDCDRAMLTIMRDNQALEWHCAHVPLTQVALHEKGLPLEYLSQSGWELSAQGQEYMRWAIGPQIEAVFDTFWPHSFNQITPSAFR